MTGVLDREATTQAEKLGLRFLKYAPQQIVELAAGIAARSKPLAPEPGWHFDVAAGDPNALVRFRRDLWEYYRERRIDRPVTLRWYDDLRVRVFLGNDMSLCLYVGGSFEPNEFVFLDSVLSPGMTFIDGGANDGVYSLFAARRVQAGGTVLAIEPSGREFERLLANLQLNSGTHIVPVRAALGHEPGEALLAVAEAGHEGQNTIGQAVSNPKVVTAAHETVPVTTVDELVSDRSLSRLDFVKLDVEGCEVDALQGALEAIWRFRPVLLLEAETERLASQGRTKDDLRQLIAELDYELFVFDAKTGRLRPAIAPDEPEGNVVALPVGWRPPAGVSTSG